MFTELHISSTSCQQRRDKCLTVVFLQAEESENPVF